MTTLRTMTPSDYPAVARISRDAAMRALVGLPYWETEAEVAAAVSVMRNAAFIVAEDENRQVVGMAGYELSLNGEAQLYGPLVAASGHGTGAWLTSRIEALAREDGAHSYSMLIGLTNKGGQTWAEWRGYLPDSEYSETLFAWLYPGDLRRALLYPGGQVRRASFDDLDQIWDLSQDCFPAMQVTRPVWNNWLGECWVLEENQAIQAVLRIQEPANFLHHLCVRRARRRHGLGARLVADAVEHYWQQTRRARIGLAARLDNTAAVSLFRRLGFTREIAVAKWTKRVG